MEFVLVVDDRTDSRELKATHVKFLRSTSIFGETIISDELSVSNGKSKYNFSDKRVALDWIKKMLDRDVDMLLLHLSELDSLLNQDEIPFSVIEPLLDLLTSNQVIENSHMDKIFKIILDSKFFRHPRNLKSYLLRLSTSPDIKRFDQVVTLVYPYTMMYAHFTQCRVARPISIQL